jgi:hypothetical protein
VNDTSHRTSRAGGEKWVPDSRKQKTDDRGQKTEDVSNFRLTIHYLLFIIDDCRFMMRLPRCARNDEVGTPDYGFRGQAREKKTGSPAAGPPA